MNSQDLLDIFKKVGGYIEGDHIVYTSGKHGEVYFNKDAIYPHTHEISLICKEIATRFKDSGVEVVAGPALGGIILSTWTAYYLSELTGREVLGVYTEKTPDKNQIFTRGYDALVKGKKVLIVEDIVTTGGSIKKVIASVKQAGGDVIGACALVNRDPKNNTSESIGTKFSSIAQSQAQAWDEKNLPDAIKNRPVNVKVGKGREYLAKKG
jgi:orotate phosphoribosyltransferase